MAKVDWDLHREQYAQLRAEKGITAREYAEYHDLNPNTARRELKKAVLNTEEAGAIRDQKSDQNSDQKRDHNGDQNRKKGKSDHNSGGAVAKGKGRKASSGKGSGGDSDSSGSENTPLSKSRKKESAKTQNAKMITNGGGEGKGELVHIKKPRGEGRRHKPGNETSIKTGEHATPRQQDYIAADEMMDQSIEALATQALRESIAHMHLIKRSVSHAVEILDQEIEAIEHPNPEDDPDPFGTHPTIKKAKLLMDVGYLHIAHNNMLSGVITSTNKVNLEDRKVTLAEAKAANLDISANIVKQAIEFRDKHGWSDIQTAEYIETFGVKVPASLMARAAKAIADIEPEVDDTGTVDEAQLDAEARAYALSKIEAANFVEQRRKEVAALTDTLGLGDHDSTGERKAGEFEEGESDLDIDYEATSDLYGEDIPPAIAIEGDDE